MKPSFTDALAGSTKEIHPKQVTKDRVSAIKQKKILVKQKKAPKKENVQAQKYALVPMWRRRRGGKTGQMK